MASILRAAQRALSSRIPLRLYSTEAKASDLKVGTFIEHESKFWQVHSVTRSAQGAQRSVLIMTELKEFKNGRKDNVRFDQDDPISVIRFDQATAEFLYREGDTLHVMNPETFDQFEMHIDQLGAAACDYLQEGMRIQLGMHDSQIMRAEMPAQVLIAVKDTDARLKNATGTSWKKATLTNGRVISVPPIINPGQNVWVRPQTDEFVRKQD